jgi:hypothetical protein
MVKNKKSKISGGEILAGVAGAAALAGGAYYLLGPKAKAHQKKAKTLMAKMKKEVESELKKAKEESGPMYQKAVDIISENYAKQYQLHGPEIKAFAKKLKREWKGAVKKATPKLVKKSTKTAKKKNTK